MCIVGGKIEKPFVKGSSKPKLELTLEMLVAENITTELSFKDGSKAVEVVEVKVLIIYPITKGEYLPSRDGIMYHYKFEGNAQLAIKVPDRLEADSTTKTINGYFNIEDEKSIEMYNVIQIL